MTQKYNKNITRAQFEIADVLRRHQVKIDPRLTPANFLTKLIVKLVGKKLKFAIEVGLKQ